MPVWMRIFAGGKSRRLYHDRVYEKKIAQDVSASWDPSMQLGGIVEITATVQAGHSPEEVQAALTEQARRLRETPPSPDEIARAKRNLESALFSQLENVGGFGGKADQLNYYEMFARDPAAFSSNLRATLAVGPEQVQKSARQYLNDEQRVMITVLPEQESEASAGEARHEPALDPSGPRFLRLRQARAARPRRSKLPRSPAAPAAPPVSRLLVPRPAAGSRSTGGLPRSDPCPAHPEQRAARASSSSATTCRSSPCRWPSARGRTPSRPEGRARFARPGSAGRGTPERDAAAMRARVRGDLGARCTRRARTRTPPACR